MLKKYLKSEFFRNLFTMMTGTVLGQVITLAAMPILSRIYSPADFGTFALVFTTISILGFISTGSYHSAIILPKSDEDALKLLKLAIVLVVVFSFLLLFVLFALPIQVYQFVGQSQFKQYVYIIPLGVLLLGFTQAFTYWHNRKKNFKTLASNKIVQSSSVAVINLTTGIIKPTPWGLIAGFILGQIITLGLLVKRSKLGISFLYFNGLKAIALKYKNFPMFLSPMVLLNTLSLNILIFLLGIYYSNEFVGLYSQAYKAINFPLLFITASYSSVFFQKLNETGNKLELYRKSYIGSLLISLAILLPVMIWGKQLFVFVFGSEWADSGIMAAILCPLTIVSFAMANVCEVFSVTQRNHILLVWQILYLGLSIFIISYFQNQGVFTMMAWFSVCGSIMYLILGAIGYLILKKHVQLVV